MSAPAHAITVALRHGTNDRASTNPRYFATCSCGHFASNGYVFAQSAHDRGQAHIDRVVQRASQTT